MNNEDIISALAYDFYHKDILNDSIDIIDGAAELSNKLDSNIPIEVTEAKPKEPASKRNEPTYEDEPVMLTDERILCEDMMNLILSEIDSRKVAGHHINSTNWFYKTGINQIATNIFMIESKIKNTRDKGDESNIDTITFSVNVESIELTPAKRTKYSSSTSIMLTPCAAKNRNMTYSTNMHMNATVRATATFINGITQTRTEKIVDHRIASIPCMVRSELCNTNKLPREALKKLNEDPTDPGGYFIIKGNEWIIDNLENITNNSFHVYRNMYGNEIVRGTFLSKPGDAFENSYQIILRYLNNGEITFELTTGKFEKFEIPFYIIFRAMGMNNDKQIIDNIVFGINNNDSITKQFKEILHKAFEVSDPKFMSLKYEKDIAKIVQFLSFKITDNININVANKDDNMLKHLNVSVLTTFDRYIFPHIGVSHDFRIRKMRFLGHLINKLLSVYIGIIEPTDRDSYSNKRVHSAGITLAKAFKTNYNLVFVQPIIKALTKEFRSTPFNQVPLADSVKAAIKGDELERMMTHSITTGEKTITIRKTEIVNRVSSQQMHRKNDLNVSSALNGVNTPGFNASKQNERADQMRRVQPSYFGYIDLSQSADTGDKVGRTKQLACTASISLNVSSFAIKDKLYHDSDVVNLDNIEPTEITYMKMAKVFVNGDWIGCCKYAKQLVDKYRTHRRRGYINHHITIVWNPTVREVYFWTDIGRLMRPLIIVYNNLQNYITKWRDNDREVKFQQWIKLTKEHIHDLRIGNIDMEYLRENRIIEYISPEEQENMLIAQNIKQLRENQYNILTPYTHCDIEQAMFGMLTLACPLVNYSSPARTTLYTNHRKQTASWFALNWDSSIYKSVTLQWYCENPPVTTMINNMSIPAGQTAIVAMGNFGNNQEDSLIVNGSSIAAGLFNATYYDFEKIELDKNEIIGNPDFDRTMEVNKNVIYEYAKETGIIKEGTIINYGTVLVIKTAKLQKPKSNYLYVDKSLIYLKHETARVDRVITTRDGDNNKIVKIVLSHTRPLRVGDKLSSRHGNKGICAMISPRADLPYTEDGLVPDIICNSHSIPTRMAINQLIEMMFDLLGAHYGSHIDGTTFREQDIDNAYKLLEEIGIKYAGTRKMYSGTTGIYYNIPIFIAPCGYQRLQKYVIDEHYANNSGPIMPITRQPREGKKKQGGLRLGEMEKDVKVAHGTMHALHEKLYVDSDMMLLPICRNCGNYAIINEYQNIYKCNICGDLADIVNTVSSCMAKVLHDEAAGMNAKITYGIKSREYDIGEDDI